MADFRLGPVDPQLRICFDREVWNGNRDPNAPPRDLGVVVVKQRDRTLFRYSMILQIPYEWSLAVDLMGLVQPDAPGRGPYFLIRYPVGTHSFRYHAVDLANIVTPGRFPDAEDVRLVLGDVGAYSVELDIDEQRVVSRSDTYLDPLGDDDFGNAECRSSDSGRADGLRLLRYARLDFDTGTVTTWKRCE